MVIITWNVQWCRGVDQRVDPSRIVAHAKALADFDVLCLQEIASNFPDPGFLAAAARTSSPRSRSSCPISRQCLAPSSMYLASPDSGATSAT